MKKREDFKKDSQAIINWIDDYFKNIESFPVKSKVSPKEVYNQLPDSPPHAPEKLSAILKNLNEIILPGITHWQHPNFHAYFTANSSMESLFAEFITAAIAAQCMIWDTSPAAAELEEKVLDWLKGNIGIPDYFEGVIQDSGSSASLVAILTAREVKTNFNSNEEGVPNNLRVYCSTQAHSSIDKAVGIAGIGKKNLVKIKVDANMRMIPDELEKQILEDIKDNFIPCCVVASLGTTGTVAVDPLRPIATISEKYKTWLHIDAAFAGSALILPEYQWMIEGIEGADSFVFNPHKWMFTNFDCSVYYVKNAEQLIKTFEVLPEYLKTKSRGAVNDYRDWGIPLGRRFRALKLWFVIRGMGISGIQEKMREHIKFNNYFSAEIKKSIYFELMTEPLLNFTCFRYKPERISDEKMLNLLNEKLLNKINSNGKIFLSHTKINSQYVLRMVIGQTYIQKKHVDLALAEIKYMAADILI